MTQSVTEKTSIPEKTRRRQTDSLGWWIAFACSSVVLHLLAFWLISLSKLNRSQGYGDSAVPIEFIEISPQTPVEPKPKPKPISPPSSNTSTNQAIIPRSQTTNSGTVKPPVSDRDRDAIAFDNQKLEQQLEAQQRQIEQQQLEAQQRQIEQQRQLEAQQGQIEQQRQLEAQQRQFAEQLRQRRVQQRQLEAQLGQREAQQQQKLADQIRQEEAEQRQLAQQAKLEAEQQRQSAIEQQNQSPVDGEKIADAPTDARGLTPQQRQKAPQAPIQQPQSRGILTASWKIDTNTFVKDKPDNLAQPLKRINSDDIPLPPPKDGNFQPRDFLVWLTIDNQGNLLLIKVDEAIPLPQRSQYQEYAEEIFNDQKFIPASENNGDRPDFSNLPIRVNIKDASQ